jgi:hypothetical protein
MKFDAKTVVPVVLMVLLQVATQLGYVPVAAPQAAPPQPCVQSE